MLTLCVLFFSMVWCSHFSSLLKMVFPRQTTTFNTLAIFIIQESVESFPTDSSIEDNPKHSIDERKPEENKVEVPHSSSMTPMKIKRQVII